MKKMFISIFMLFVYLFNYNIYLENKYEDLSSYVTKINARELSTNYEALLSNSINNVFNDEYYAPYYFKNLIQSFPLNSHGTCNFTSIAMLLSFYDTYWYDAVIEEKYELRSTTSSYNIPNFETVYSPGLKFESEDNYNMTSLQYSSFVTQTRNTYFQSYLINLAIEANISISNVNLGANYNQVYNLIDYYLNYVNTYTKNKFYISSNIKEYMSAINYTIYKVSEGIPVLLRIGNSTTNEGHTVIAYDIDEESGEIFVHTGWKKNNTALTHVPLSLMYQVLGYNVVYDAISLMPSMNHIHSENYEYGNHETFCACKYMYPSNIKHGNNYYIDTLATYDFIATTKERWYEEDDFNYSIEIKDKNNQIVVNQEVEGNSFTLTKLGDINHLVNLDDYYSVKINCIYNGNDTYMNNRECSKMLLPPSTSKVNLIPSETNVTTHYFHPSILINYEINDYTLDATYHHFIYDEENELLRLSCMPGEDNYAFIIYNLDFATTRVDFELAIKDENQGLDVGEYEVVLYDYDVNNNLEEITKVVGTNAIDTSLPVGINNLKKYIVYLDEPHETIIFKVNFLEGSLVPGSYGEIYYGNTSFYPYNAALPLPVSGYELPYEPDKWNNTLVNGEYIYEGTNCYAYALDAPFAPDENDSLWYENPDGYVKPMYINENTVINKNHLINDSIKYGFTCIQVNKYEICPIGTYKIAFYRVYDSDYHFIRQNYDGTWSHKNGNHQVHNLNIDKDELLLDPDNAFNIYHEASLIGYFAITPIEYEGENIWERNI